MTFMTSMTGIGARALSGPRRPMEMDTPSLVRCLRLEGIDLAADGQTLRATGLSDALARWQRTLTRHGWSIHRYIEAQALVDFEEWP